MPTTIAAGTDLDTLQELNREYIRSVQESDVRRFDEILADDFVCTNPDGTFLDRAAFLVQTAVSGGHLQPGGPGRAGPDHGRRRADPRADRLHQARRRDGGRRPLHRRVGAPRRPLAGGGGARHPLLRASHAAVARTPAARARALPRHERGHDLLAEPGELLEHHVLRRAHAVAEVHVLEAGVGRLE